MISLTPKEAELYAYLRQRISATGVGPSFEEMREAMGLNSKSGVHRILTALELKGRIRRLPHRARAIEIIGDGQADPYSVRAVARTALEALGIKPSETNLSDLVHTLQRCEASQ